MKILSKKDIAMVRKLILEFKKVASGSDDAWVRKLIGQIADDVEDKLLQLLGKGKPEDTK